MLGELVEIVTKLFEVSDRLKQSEDEDRKRVIKYFDQVGDCLLGIEQELRNGNPYHGRWGELQEYARNFPKSISKSIGEDKEKELSLLLEAIVNNTPEDDSDIKTIATTGGRFKALAVNIATENGEAPPPVKQPKQPIPVNGEAPPPVNRQYQPSVRWKMVSFLGESTKNKVILFDAPLMISERIKAITKGQFIIEVDTTGNILTEEILQKVSAGDDIQCGFSGIYYEQEKYRPLYFGCAVPFGLSPQEQTAWLSYKKDPNDQLTYIQSLYREIGLNVIPFPAGATGGQMGGWFKKEINTVADFNGLTMRIPGLGADVLSDYFGIKTDKKIFGKALSIGEISTELEKGTIQAAEWIGPHDDFQLNLHKAGAKYYYYPGWWEPSTTFDVQVNKDAWENLPPEYQRIFEAVCHETYTKILSEYDRRNARTLGDIRKLESSGNIKILPFPDEVLQVAQAKTEELLKLYDANPQFKEVHDEWEGFKTQMRSWDDLSDLTKIMSRLNQPINMVVQ